MAIIKSAPFLYAHLVKPTAEFGGLIGKIFLYKNDMPMKTLLKKLCLAAVCLLAANTATAYDFEYEGCYFNILSETDKTCEITYEKWGIETPTYSGDLVIPELVKDDEGIIYKVTTIGEGAFYNCTSLTSVTIPESVTTIDLNAFQYCTSLTSVTIPESVMSIGDGAFYGCTSLNSVTIPESVTTIGMGAFHMCTSLTSVTIPESVTTIGNTAFSYCTSLTSVTIPESVTTIGNDVFSFCTSLTSVTIPESVTTIGDYAFSYCTSLTSVTIPESVTTIGERVFYHCESLTSVTIPKSVTTIGMGAFAGCQSLKEITVDENNNHFVTWNRLLYSKDITTLYWCPMFVTLTSVNIPKTTTIIKGYAFYLCKKLYSVTIPESVKEIGRFAFTDCTSLTSINIPKSVTSLKSGTFENCYNLIEIKIPSSVTTIENDVFSYCKGLTELVIPSSVVSMNNWLVLGCTNLNKFYIEDGFSPIEIKSIGSMVGAWNNFKELYIGRSVIVDQNNDFIGDGTGLEEVTFSQFVTSVDDIGMDNAKDLKKVVVCGDTPPTITDDFFSTYQYNNATLYVPEGTYDTYTKATGWRYFYNIVEGMPTGVSQVESPAKTTVTAGDGCIMVSNAKGAIQVYTSAGTLVKSTTASGDTEITVPGHGVYIVKTGGETVKVSL